MVGHNNNVQGGNIPQAPQNQVANYTPDTTRVGYMVPNPYDFNIRNTSTTQNPTFIHVQGEMEARVWPVANGYTAVLFDNDEAHVYVKGPNGFVKYTRDDNLEEYPYQQVDLTGYVKADDVQNMISEALNQFSQSLQQDTRPSGPNKKYNNNKNRGGNNYEKKR